MRCSPARQLGANLRQTAENARLPNAQEQLYQPLHVLSAEPTGGIVLSNITATAKKLKITLQL